MDKRIFISRQFPDIGINLLKESGFLVTVWNQDQPLDQEALIKYSKNHDALWCTSADRIDSHFLRQNQHLELISQYAAGYNNIDLQEATNLGIPISNTPNAMNNATADIAFGLMIATSRKMFHMHKTILNNQWSHFKPKANLGIELNNKTLGVFGLGRIGFEMAKRCKSAYNMNIIYHNRSPNRHAENKLDAKYVDFSTLLSQSDVISVHSLLTPQTSGVFNKHAFDRMKNSAIFINTSRGLIHDEIDLIDALEKESIWGAGLDVTNPEPMKSNNPLLQMENACVLPHIGSATVQARDDMSKIAAINIIDFYKNKTYTHILNRECLNNKNTA